MLDPDERRWLLAVAREAIRSKVLALPPPRPSFPPSGSLAEPGAAFVTIYRRAASGEDALRGCIGTFDRSRSLGETVEEVAVSAALRDPRFPPVAPHELDSLALSISVLSPRRPARPEEVEVGRHGLAVSRRGARGVLLPQVATEQGWDRETFLAQTCKKAGLPPDAWRDPATAIEVFEAEVFGEETT